MSWFRRKRSEARDQPELFATVPLCLVGILRTYGFDAEATIKTRWINGYLLGLIGFLQETRPELANPTGRYLFEYLHVGQGKEALAKTLALHAKEDPQVTDGMGFGYPDGSRCFTTDGRESLADIYQSLLVAIKTQRIDNDQTI